MAALGQFASLATDVSKIGGDLLLVKGTVWAANAIGKIANATMDNAPSPQVNAKLNAGMTPAQARNPNIPAPTF